MRDCQTEIFTCILLNLVVWQNTANTSADYIPSDHHIFAVWLGLQAFDGFQLDLGLSLPIQLHLISEKAHLSGQMVDGLWHTGARDRDVTVGVVNKITKKGFFFPTRDETARTSMSMRKKD